MGQNWKNFLYMLPEKFSAKQLSEIPEFLKPGQIEVWTEMNLLEITLANGTITFEDMMDNLTGEADRRLLASMKITQVYACDYEESDSLKVQELMKCLLARTGGVLASDTEDFKPFLQAEEL